MAETETRLTYRIRRLNIEERTELLSRLGLGRTTLFTRLREPRKLQLGELEIIMDFLEALDDCDYDMSVLLLPVELHAEAPAS